MPLEIPDYNVWQLVFNSLYHVKGRPMRDLKIAQFRGDSFEDMLLKVGIDPKYIKRAYMLTSKTRPSRIKKFQRWMQYYIDAVVGDRIDDKSVRDMRRHFNTYSHNYMPTRGPVSHAHRILHARINARVQ